MNKTTPRLLLLLAVIVCRTTGTSAQNTVSPTFSNEEKAFLFDRLQLSKDPEERSKEYQISGFPNFDDKSIGRAYIHRQVDSKELSMATLAPKGLTANAAFGFDVDLLHTTAIVGAPGGGQLHQGEAYLFEKYGHMWRKTMRFAAPDGAPRDDFGYGVAQTMTKVAIGAPSANSAYLHTGAVYVYQSPKIGEWTFQQKIQPRKDRNVVRFGKYVEFRNEMLLVGAESYKEQQDIAFVYEFREGVWTQTDLLDTTEELQVFFLNRPFPQPGDTPLQEDSDLVGDDQAEIVVGTKHSELTEH